MADLVVDPKLIHRNWILLWGAWLVVLFFDWLFGLSLLWLIVFLVWGAAYYFVPMDNLLKTQGKPLSGSNLRSQVFLVKLVIDILISIFFPSRMLAHLCNMALFGIVIMIQNIYVWHTHTPSTQLLTTFRVLKCKLMFPWQPWPSWA